MRSNSAFKRYKPYPKCVTNPTKVVPSTSKTISNSEIKIVKIGSQANLNKNTNNNNQDNKEYKQQQSVSKVNEWVVESSNEITNKSQILPDEKKCSKYDLKKSKLKKKK
jgi:hypothetical protein